MGDVTPMQPPQPPGAVPTRPVTGVAWHGLPFGVSYASWGSRALALLLDSVFLFLCIAPGIVPLIVWDVATAGPGSEVPLAARIAGAAAILVGIAAWHVNYYWTHGAKGQSWGKRVVGIHLVRESDLHPPGGGMGIARSLLRSALGQATCGVYSVVTALWPLWDERNRTLDDKILNTLVVRLPPGR